MPPAAAVIAEQFQQGLARHQAGRLDEAQAAYEAILQAQPGHADSLHLLGVIACQRGDYAAAAGLIGQALQGNPKAAAYHSNLGIAQRELGQLPQAAASFRAALALNPDYPEAYCNLAVALEELGQLDEAEQACRAALALKPAYVEAHLNLGMVLKAQGHLPEAAAAFRQTLVLSPNSAKAHCNLGVTLKELNQLDQALMCYGRALMIDPDYAEAHLNLSNLLRVQGHFEEALGACQQALRLKPDAPLSHLCLGNAQDALGLYAEAADSFRQAIRLKPDFAQAWSNLGNVLKQLGEFPQAEEACRTAVRIKPDYAQAHSNLGNVLKELNQLDGAAACYQTALACDADYAQGHLNLGITRLLAGRFAEGWPDYEWRWQVEDWPQRARHGSHPRWSGDAADGRTILIWPEQGLGDLIHFVRYLPLLVQAGWRVVLETPSALLRLFQNIDGVTVLPFGSELPPIHVQCPLLSLPGVMGIEIPAAPYLRPEPALAAFWRNRLDGLAGHKVGFAWRGNPKLMRDRNRSLPATAFAPLMALPGVTPVILQKDAREDELAALGLPANARPDLTDFADTAAVMAGLDLVISVDTSVAHLAGALGVPVWTLLEFAPDWRWQLDRADSPWYPSMRLYRQTNHGDWPQVLERVRADLAVWP